MTIQTEQKERNRVRAALRDIRNTKFEFIEGYASDISRSLTLGGTERRHNYGIAVQQRGEEWQEYGFIRYAQNCKLVPLEALAIPETHPAYEKFNEVFREAHKKMLRTMTKMLYGSSKEGDYTKFKISVITQGDQA